MKFEGVMPALITPMTKEGKLNKPVLKKLIEDLIAQGYLTDAVVNYVALLGWAPGGEREIYSLSELEDAFDIKGISKSPAIFDLAKLRYFNAEYIRAMEPDRFAAVAEPYIRSVVKKDSVDAAAVAALLQQRCEVLSEIPEKVDFFEALPDYELALFTNKKSKSTSESSLAFLRVIAPRLEALTAWTDEEILSMLTELAAEQEVKNAKVMWPLRIAVSGRTVTPGGAVELCRILGREETLRRIAAAVERLEAAV